MGEVFEAWDSTISRRLALKSLRPDRQEFEEAFLEEARVAGRLEHPHIVPVHGLGYLDGSPYFTMTWVDGETLEERLRGNFGTRDALREHLEVLAKVVDAVGYAHERGVIHRDLKPENILMGKFGRVYVTDWGVARVWDRERFQHSSRDEVSGVDAPDGTRIGTIEYMAPEQVRGENSSLGPACDIWALGVMLYQCLAGRTPFRGANLEETAANVLAGEFEPASVRVGNSHAPAELERIIDRALQYRPEDRYDDLSSFERDLRAFLRGTADLPQRKYSRGDVIVLQGDIGQEAYILEKGRCDVWVDTGGAQPTRVGSIEAGEFFGEAALVSDTERSASVVATNECVVSVVGRETVDQEKGRMRPWLASFVSTLVDRFRTANSELSKLKARSDEDVLHQACLWLHAFGEVDGDDLVGSWRRCSDHVMRWTDLGRGPLRALLEAQPGVSVDGRADQLRIEGGLERLRRAEEANG